MFFFFQVYAWQTNTYKPVQNHYARGHTPNSLNKTAETSSSKKSTNSLRFLQTKRSTFHKLDMHNNTSFSQRDMVFNKPQACQESQQTVCGSVTLYSFHRVQTAPRLSFMVVIHSFIVCSPNWCSAMT